MVAKDGAPIRFHEWRSPADMAGKSEPQPAVWFPTIRCKTGTDVFTERLVEGLRAKGIRAEIDWLPHRAEYAPWSVPVPVAPPWANVVHVNSWLPPRFVPEGLPVVVTVHHSVHHPQADAFKSAMQRQYHRRWILPIEHWQVLHAQAVVGVSRHVAGEIQRLFDGKEAFVVPNGIDTRRLFTPGGREAPGRPFRLLYVGNWMLRKGVDLLGPVMERLGSGFELWYTADRDETLRNRSLPTNSKCLGRLAGMKLVQAYRDADVFLFPSRSEGMPLTAIEAMACGLPVVASNIAPLKEVVEHGATGLLCPVDDVDAFVQAVKSLQKDPVRLSAMSKAARERADGLFSLPRMVGAYLSIYRQLVT